MPETDNKKREPCKKSWKTNKASCAKQLTDLSLDGILVFNEELDLCYTNKAIYKILKLEENSLALGTNLRELSSTSIIFEYIRNLVFKLKSNAGVTTARVAAFDDLYLGIRGFVIKDSEFAPKCFEIIVYDATDFLNSQKIITQAEKMDSLGHLTNGIAHEINNPLAGISNAIYLLRSNKLDKEKQLSILGKLEKNINKIYKVVEDISFFSRQNITENKPVDLIKIIQEDLAVIKSQHEDSKITIKTQFPSEKLHVFGGGIQLRQMLFNILLNSYQAMEDGNGELSISLEKECREGKKIVKIKISDTGCGMTQEEIDHVFDPFYTNKRVWDGIGLGLTISYRIVQLLHGTMVFSSKPNEGTTVLITLPCTN